MREIERLRVRANPLDVDDHHLRARDRHRREQRRGAPTRPAPTMTIFGWRIVVSVVDRSLAATVGQRLLAPKGPNAFGMRKV